MILAGFGCFDGSRESFVPVLGSSLSALKMQISAYQNGMLTLSDGKNTLKLKNQSCFASFNGTPVALIDAGGIDGNGSWQVSGRVLKHQLLPVVQDLRFPVRRIVLDPGHGGHDRGAQSVHGKSEKSLNLLLARAVAGELQKAGFEVFLTRQNDKYISLDDRPLVAEKQKADLFISIHHNAASRQGASGLEIFTLSCQDEKELSTAGNSSNLALYLYRELAPLNYFPGRGVKSARFKVLRQSRCPALLVEAGFLTNPAESAYLETPFYRKQFAQAFARALTAFVKP